MRSKINIQGNLIGEPTPSQEKLINTPAFKLALQLYKVALDKGQQTASTRLSLINQSMTKAAEQDQELVSPPCIP